VGLGNSLLARQFVFEIAEAGGVVGAGDAILRGLLERIERGSQRTLGGAGDGGFIGWTKAGIGEDGLVLREQRVADLLLRAEELIVERVDAGELLVGEFLCLGLGAGHFPSGKPLVVKAFAEWRPGIVALPA